MMTNMQYLLTKLAEECTEAAQMALKCQQFGLDETQNGLTVTNKQRLHGEIDDILAVISILNTECGFEFKENPIAIIQKTEKIFKYRDYSKSLKLVEDGKNDSNQMFNKILGKIKEQLDSMALPVEKMQHAKKTKKLDRNSFDNKLEILQKFLPDLDLNIKGRQVTVKVNGIESPVRFAAKQTKKGQSAWSIKNTKPGELMIMLDNDQLYNLVVVRKDWISKSGAVWISQGTARDVAAKLTIGRVINSLS